MNAYYGTGCIGRRLTSPRRGTAYSTRGGTDLYPADAHRRGWGEVSLSVESERPVLDISNVDGLDQIEVDQHTVTIGARVTWSEAVASKLGGWFDGVRKAAVEVGGRRCKIAARSLATSVMRRSQQTASPPCSP